MPHIESGEQAVQRLEHAAERHRRTIRRVKGDERRTAHAQHHYVATVRNARQQVRYVSGMPNFEQGILGTTGSPEELKKYRELAQQLGKQAGQPLVAIESVSAGGYQVGQAVVGEIDGSLEVWANFLDRSPTTVTDSHQEATLQVPANGLTRFSRGEGRAWIPTRANEHGSHVRMADIILDEAANPTNNPERDFIVNDRREEGLILLGEEAIRESRLFGPDLKEILDMAGMPV